VDFSGSDEDEYQAAKEWLCEPRVPIREEVEKQLYDAASRGSVDAVYGTGKLYLETDIATAIGYFELAAKQGHSYAESQLGRIYCFGLGVPQNLEAGIEWLKASADHGNEHAASLLSRVQEGLQNVALNAASALLCSLASMLHASGEQNLQKRLRADRKQISRTAQKKQAQGLHHQEEYQGQTMG
jgi:TPR repeat protein